MSPSAALAYRSVKTLHYLIGTGTNLTSGLHAEISTQPTLLQGVTESFFVTLLLFNIYVSLAVVHSTK